MSTDEGETDSASVSEQEQGPKQVTCEQSSEEQEAADRWSVARERGGPVGGGNGKNEGSSQMLPPQSGCP